MMHLCVQVVISARGVDDKAQFSGSTRFGCPAHLLLPRPCDVPPVALGQLKYGKPTDDLELGVHMTFEIFQ